MRGVELAKRQIKVKTLQNCNTKALLASVGHFQEKFIQGLHYRWRGAGGKGAEGAGEAGGDEGDKGELLNKFLSSCPMPHNK